MQRGRLTLLLPDLRGGGAERAGLSLARAFAGMGYETEFALMRATGAFLEEARREFRVTELGVRRVRQVPWPLSRYLKARRPEALIANMWPLTSVAVVGRALSGLDCALLLVEHGILSRQYAGRGRLHRLAMGTSMRASYPRADRVVAVSTGAARDTARLAGLPADRVAVIHNPVPPGTEPSARDRARAEAVWRCPPGARILSVGSFKAQKNHALLLRAFACLDRPEARLVLLGQGREEATLRALATELGLEDRVIFAGFLDDPAPFYATADLFALSSDSEGFGNVIVEALSFGLPVVATDCPAGPAEILAGGRLGHLVPVGDAEALARAMAATLATPADPGALRRRAAAFAPDKAANAYQGLFREPAAGGC